MIDLAKVRPVPPSLNSLEELVTCCERRLKRAEAKLQGAQMEFTEACAALERARANRADWIANNPDPQLLLC